MRAFLSIPLLLAPLVYASVFAQRTPAPMPSVVCGDGVSQASEECDDGNTMAGDGCSGICELEVARAAETPLPTRAVATPVSAFTDETGGRYSLRKGRVRAEVATGILTVHRDDDGRGIEFDFGTAVPTLRGEQATFAVGGLEWDTAITTTGTKATAIVAALRGPQIYRFPFRLLNLLGDASITANGDADFGPFKILRLWATDANGVRRDASPWRVVGGVLEADFDDAGLAVPYVIDPTTVFSFVGTWWNAGWLYRQKITCGGQNAPASNLGGGTITSGFPCRVTLTSGTVANDAIGVNFSNFNPTQSATAQGDLCFIADDQTTVLNHEVEVWNTSSTDQVCTGANCATIWVGVPTVTASTGTAIWLYYGNSSATNCAGTVPSKTGMWGNSYNAVWHLNETGANPTWQDATANNADTAANTADGGSGRSAGGAVFAGAEYARLAATTLFSPGANNFTLEMQVVTSTTGVQQLALNRAGNKAYALELNTLGKLVGFIRDAEADSVSPTTAASLADGFWHSVALVRSGTTASVYVDGASTGATNAALGTTVDSTCTLYFGGADTSVGCSTNAGDEAFLTATLDEIRYSSTNRTAAWLLATHDTIRGAFNIGAGASNTYVEETRRRQRPQMTY